VKKAEIRTLLQNIDKETAATVTYDEFLDMAAPKVANRDEREEIQKVRWNYQLHSLSLSCTAKGKGPYLFLLPSFPPSLPPSFPPF